MKDLRKEIDSIDRDLADLLNRRLDVVKKIGAYKLARGIPVLDEEREKEKLQAFAEQFDNVHVCPYLTKNYLICRKQGQVSAAYTKRM